MIKLAYISADWENLLAPISRPQKAGHYQLLMIVIEANNDSTRSPTRHHNNKKLFHKNSVADQWQSCGSSTLDVTRPLANSASPVAR